MARTRHPQGAHVRETHTLSPIDFASPSDRLYGSEMDIESVSVLDLGQGSVTDGAIAEGGLDGGSLIRGGTLPPAAFDQTPPLLPSDFTLTNVSLPSSDGSTVLGIEVSLVWTTPPEDDLFATYVYVTAKNDKDPANPQPIWDQPSVSLIGKNETKTVVSGVAGATPHWVQLRAVDVMGNYSPPSSYRYIVTGSDNVAPAVPQGVAGAGGYKSIGVRWTGSAAQDLMHNEVRYRLGTGDWSVLRTRGSSLTVGGLEPGDYYAQVRAIDFSGNVATSDADATAVNYLQNPDAGWSAMVGPMTASLVGQSDIALGSVIAGIVAADHIDAGTIEAGVLTITTEDGEGADGIEVVYGGEVVGEWNESGLFIRSHTKPLLDYLHLDDASLNIYHDGGLMSAITTEGINASALNFGTSPGGHNLVFNSSFELSKFVATSDAVLGAGGATFAGGVGGWAVASNVNATLGASAITMAVL